MVTRLVGQGSGQGKRGEKGRTRGVDVDVMAKIGIHMSMQTERLGRKIMTPHNNASSRVFALRGQLQFFPFSSKTTPRRLASPSPRVSCMLVERGCRWVNYQVLELRCPTFFNPLGARATHRGTVNKVRNALTSLQRSIAPRPCRRPAAGWECRSRHCRKVIRPSIRRLVVLI